MEVLALLAYVAALVLFAIAGWMLTLRLVAAGLAALTIALAITHGVL